MPAPQTVTTKQIEAIQKLRALRVPLKVIADKLGVSTNTVQRYSSPQALKADIRRQRRRYERERQNPEVVERRRAQNREYQRRKREEARRVRDTEKAQDQA